MPRTGESLDARAALDSGWADLRAGRWSAARASFERAIAAEPTAEGYEGLSWAAWWLDDAETLFAARERAFRRYRQFGDRTAAARMATWLACDELDFRGAHVVAGGWLARAERMLEGLPTAAEHGWLAFFQGYMTSAGGDAATAAELAHRAAEIGRELEVPDIEMLGLALEGSIRVACAEVDAGMQRLDEATAAALAGDAAVPIAGAWAFCFLVTACAAVRDYERAAEWCDRIAEFAERYGSRYMLAFCRAEYGVVHLWHGRWREAEAVLEDSVEDFSRSRPAMTGGSLVALAELRRRQGRLDEAVRLLEQAGSSRPAQLTEARLALDRGQTLRAVELAERVLRQMPTHGGVDRAPALELLVPARIARGDLDGAADALDALRDIAGLVGTTGLRASALLANGMLAAARGEPEPARILFEDAIDGFTRVGGRYDAARARIELASALRALGRDDAARSEAAEAHATLRAIGAAPEAARAQQLIESRRPDEDPAAGRVTRREGEVLRLLATGLTNREIAQRLVLSEHTVHRHVTNILRKLDLPSRTAAAAFAVSHGLTSPPVE